MIFFHDMKGNITFNVTLPDSEFSAFRCRKRVEMNHSLIVGAREKAELPIFG